MVSINTVFLYNNCYFERLLVIVPSVKQFLLRRSAHDTFKPSHHISKTATSRHSRQTADSRQPYGSRTAASLHLLRSLATAKQRPHGNFTAPSRQLHNSLAAAKQQLESTLMAASQQPQSSLTAASQQPNSRLRAASQHPHGNYTAASQHHGTLTRATNFPRPSHRSTPARTLQKGV